MGTKLVPGAVGDGEATQQAGALGRGLVHPSSARIFPKGGGETMKHLVAVALGLSLGACVSTQEMPLAPNVVRMDTAARGAFFVASASNVTLKKAAEATLARGYTHFLLFDPQMSQGSQIVGMTGSGYGTATTVGGTTYVQTTGFGTPIRAPTSNVGVTVVMYRANEPEARGAFDAAQIVKQFGG